MSGGWSSLISDGVGYRTCWILDTHSIGFKTAMSWGLFCLLSVRSSILGTYGVFVHFHCVCVVGVIFVFLKRGSICVGVNY